MTTGKRQIAIQNNMDLCKIILSSHHLKSYETDDIWYCLDQTPPLYSNLITKKETWAPDSIFDTIGRVCESQRWVEWSIKDSHGTLDLTPYGFLKLFDAQWIYLSSNRFKTAHDTHIHFKIMKDKDSLVQWINAWENGEMESTGNRIFTLELLHNETVYFITAYQGTQIIGGCLINKSDNILGISNSFGPGDSQYWSSLISFVLENIAPLNIVGYFRDDLLHMLLSLSFEPVGNVSVWLKKSRT